MKFSELSATIPVVTAIPALTVVDRLAVLAKRARSGEREAPPMLRST